MVRQAAGTVGRDAESSMMEYQKGTKITQKQGANIGVERASTRYSHNVDEIREPHSDFEAAVESREEYDSEIRAESSHYGDTFTNQSSELVGGSSELAQKVQQHSRDSSTSLSTHSTTEQRDEAPSSMNKLNSAEDMLMALVQAVDSNSQKDEETGSSASTSVEGTTCDQDALQATIDTTPIDVRAMISKNNNQFLSTPVRSMPSTKEWRGDAASRNAHRTIQLSTSKHGHRQVDGAYTTKDTHEKDIKGPQDSYEMSEISLHDTLDDTSNKLDAALSMMEQLQREDADRKILSMMSVQTSEHEDSNESTQHISKIDWETGEYEHTPWVGQVGINDEIFEDEPLDYDDTASCENSQRRKTWAAKIPLRMVLVSTAGILLTAAALGAAAIYQSHKNNEPCSLCYDGSNPDDLGSSMVGGQTCADFRTSVESYTSSDKMCLQEQSLAWLMCDCPTLPPFPKRPLCTLCGEGILLDGSACNHINTFMAHISDPDYCEALKSSVSKAGCACPNE